MARDGLRCAGGQARLFLVDDHPLMLYGTQRYLDDRYDLVGTATEVPAAVEMILDRKPDLVVLDVQMPGGGVASVIEIVRKRDQGIKFLASSVSPTADDVRRLMAAGVDGYVTKTGVGVELEEQIDLVLAGGRPISAEVATLILNMAETDSRTKNPKPLTAKELEVVTLRARGLKYREIAAELDISLKVLESLMKNVFDKTGGEGSGPPPAGVREPRNPIDPRDEGQFGLPLPD